MIERKNDLKTFALLNFIGFLSIFLLFKNGYFNQNVQKENQNNFTSSNGGTPTKINEDSSLIIIEIKQRQRFSSSKSAIMVDDFSFFQSTSYNLTSRLIYGIKKGVVFDTNTLKPSKIEMKSYRPNSLKIIKTDSLGFKCKKKLF